MNQTNASYTLSIYLIVKVGIHYRNSLENKQTCILPKNIYQVTNYNNTNKLDMEYWNKFANVIKVCLSFLG